VGRIAVVGLTTIDWIDGDTSTPGGVPLHAMRALREFGAPGITATKVAAADRQLLAQVDELAEELAWRAAAETATYTLVHDPRLLERQVIIEALGDAWQPAEIDDWVLEATRGCSFVHAGALSLADFPTETLVQLARTHRVSLDGQGLVRPARLGPVVHERPSSLEMLEHIEVLKLALEEAAVLGIEPTSESVARLGVAEVVLTNGEEGAWIFAAGELVEIPGAPVSVKNTSGAGDGFIACYLAARSEGASPRDAGARAADAVSALLRNRAGTW
jgi:sugar/nucleoside kinase (ribokinase family)